MSSAYPVPIDTLIPQARQLAHELGTVPSRNRLMSHFHIGGRKAAQLLDALTPTGDTNDTTPEDTTPEDTTDPSYVDGRRITTATPDGGLTDTDQSDRSDPSRPAGDDASAPGLPGGPATAGSGQLTTVVSPPVQPVRRRRWLPAAWPLLLLALPAFVAIWSGWVGLAELAGFGVVHPLPGIADGFTLNTAITLPIGVETYAAYALRVALAGGAAVSGRARRFAGWSAGASLGLGALGQIAYHLMSAAHLHTAPWPITTVVACLPVVVLGFAAALEHLQHHPATTTAADVASAAGSEVSR